MKNIILSICASVLVFSACKKDDNIQNNEDVQQSVLNDFSSNICIYTYSELASSSDRLYQNMLALQQGKSDLILNQCRTDWKATRAVWEHSEAWLFGPVATESIDPRIDTWPVDFNRLDSVLNSSMQFDDNSINGLEESLKGFHPIEYILYGLNGNKTANDLNDRELDFAVALAKNLRDLTSELVMAWETQHGNYAGKLTGAGSNTEFPTRQSAYLEMVSAMSGICDEVANGKIGEVFTNLDSMGEESPFSKNSITDFTNNIRGVQQVYLGMNADGKDARGLEDFIRQHNLSLDAQIKQKMAVAIQSLALITDPFGRAIHTQPIQVQNAIDAINALKDILDEQAIPLIHLHIK